MALECDKELVDDKQQAMLECMQREEECSFCPKDFGTVG
jgi:hypothetical protein